MTTATIPMGVLVGPGPTTAAQRIGNLRAAFAVRLRTISGQVLSASVAFIKSVAAKTMSFIPKTLGTLGVAAALATRQGFDFATNVISTVGRFGRWLARKVVGVVNTAIDWTGHRVADVVGVFSESGRDNVNDFVAAFRNQRDMAVGFVVSTAERVGNTVMNAVRSPLTRGAVGIVSGGVAALIAVKMLVPSVFGGLVSMLPGAAGLMFAIAAGGWFPLAVVGAVAGVATLLSLAGKAVYSRTEPGREGKPFRQAWTEFKTEIADDEDLLARARADASFMRKVNKAREAEVAQQAEQQAEQVVAEATGTVIEGEVVSVTDEPPVEAEAETPSEEELKALADHLAAGSLDNVGSKRRERSGNPAARAGR